jgi:hypothetical protein
MESNAVKRELLNLERRFWQAAKERDVGTMSRLTDFPCILTGPQGVTRVDESTFSSMMKTDPATLQDFTLDDNAEVRMLADDVALVAYRVHEKVAVEGVPLVLDAVEASVWVRRDAEWRCAMHTEAISGDAYGRDRQAVH